LRLAAQEQIGFIRDAMIARRKLDLCWLPLWDTSRKCDSIVSAMNRSAKDNAPSSGGRCWLTRNRQRCARNVECPIPSLLRFFALEYTCVSPELAGIPGTPQKYVFWPRPRKSGIRRGRRYPLQIQCARKRRRPRVQIALVVKVIPLIGKKKRPRIADKFRTSSVNKVASGFRTTLETRRAWARYAGQITPSWDGTS